jgi:hypothetical protein
MSISQLYFKEKNKSLPSPDNSKELNQLVDDNEHTNPFVKVIKPLQYMGQKDSNDDRCFPKEEYVYAQLMVPNQRRTADLAEQTFHALLKNGK